MRSLLCALLLILPPCLATAQEADIAEDEKWYLLGETLFMYEQGAIVAVGDEAAKCIEADALRWAAALEEAAPDDAAREMAYLDRIAALQYLQPAAARASGLALPSVPELIAVLAPEDDEAGTPKDFEARAEYLITGRLRYELDNPEHMGLAVETGLGLQVFVFLMELGNQPAHDVLLALAQAGSDEQFLVAGSRLEAADGIPNLRTDQCRWVYRPAQ
jgi:hypothetical protein